MVESNGLKTFPKHVPTFIMFRDVPTTALSGQLWRRNDKRRSDRSAELPPLPKKPPDAAFLRKTFPPSSANWNVGKSP